MKRLRKMTAALYRNTKDVMSGVIDREFLPVPRRDDDLFLVEFPKSGITWLTFLIANMNVLINNDDRKITLFNINDFVHGVQSVRYVENMAHRLPGYRIFKSHANYLRRYRKVVYLIRDPRHVMVSYWVFLRGLGEWSGSFEEFVEDRRFGISAWRAHVEGWLDKVDAATSFTLLKYEELLENPQREIRRVYDLLGIEVSQEQAEVVVERANIKNLSNLELEFNARHPALKKLEFFRKGKTGGAREVVSEEALRSIEKHAGDVMKRMGY